MAKKIRVLLLENHPELGQAGQIVSVSEGYARNYLFPQGKAALADEKTTSRIEAENKSAAKKAVAELAGLQQIADSLAGTELVMAARIKEGEEIYGSISTREIAAELNRQANLALKPTALELPEKITRLGHYEMTVNLSPQVSTVLIVVVEAAS